MLFYQLRRMKRTLVASGTVLLFAAVMVFILCSLHISTQQELAEYERVVQETPIILEITNLNGTMDKDLDLPNWVYRVFTSDRVENSLKGYVEEVRLEARYVTDSVLIDAVPAETAEWMVSGINFESQIPMENGQSVNWLPGYDAQILATANKVCIIPQTLAQDGVPETMTLYFSHVDASPTGGGYYSYELELTVAGTYPGTDIYCPFFVMRSIYSNLGKKITFGSLSAVLIDNSLQQEATEVARKWFPAPDLSGKRVPWDYSWYTFHPYALRVDDSQLVAAKVAMENSITINNLCTVIVLIISAAAGFLIGFLMVRSRKREIALLRTMGTSDWIIYLGFVAEQMLCVLLGTAIGGAFNLWQPIQRLGIFVGVYFVGLTVALAVFLRTNLLTSLKEE